MQMLLDFVYEDDPSPVSRGVYEPQGESESLGCQIPG